MTDIPHSYHPLLGQYLQNPGDDRPRIVVKSIGIISIVEVSRIVPLPPMAHESHFHMADDIVAVLQRRSELVEVAEYAINWSILFGTRLEAQIPGIDKLGDQLDTSLPHHTQIVDDLVVQIRLRDIAISVVVEEIVFANECHALFTVTLQLAQLQGRTGLISVVICIDASVPPPLGVGEKV